MSEGPRSGLITDGVLTLPADAVVNNKTGFAIDIGTTVTKLIYRSNQEYKNGRRITEGDNPERGSVHYALFPRTDVDGAIKYLLKHADIQRNEDGIAEVQGSGVGCGIFKKQLEEGLGGKLTITTEFDSYARAFLAISKTFSSEELFYPHSEKAIAGANRIKEALAAFSQATAKRGKKMEFGLGNEAAAKEEKQEEKEKEGCNPHLPCLLFMCGSGTGALKIERDGTYKLLEGPFSGGRFFYGVASQLGGTNDFDKLIEMASTADGRSVDIYTKDIMGDIPKKQDEQNFYNMFDADILAFPFGKAADAKKEDIKKEDMIYSLYNTVAGLHSQHAYMLSQITNIRQIYFCGNLFNNQLGRDLVIERKGMNDAYVEPDKVCDFGFIKNGGMLCALGAYISDKTS